MSQNLNDDHFMLRALELAARGRGHVSPNPQVGAVVVYNGKIIGEGWHERYGEAHAEVNAIDSVSDKSLLPKATIYVTLEPCSHWGKTPPCCDLIISKQIPRAVIGCVDPYHEVCGGGIERMRQAGIDVVVGVLTKECEELNARFFTTHTQQRPYIILKWAETSDGYIDMVRPATVPPAWMTGSECRKLVHEWRAEEEAIMVGRHTVEMDNPSLTVREAEGRNPLRITMDRNLALSPDSNIFDSQAPTILFTSHENYEAAKLKFASHEQVEIMALDYTQPIIVQILTTLYCRRIHSLFVEGGKELLQSFIDAEQWDEARIFVAPISSEELYPTLTATCGVPAPTLDRSTARIRQISKVTLLEIRKATKDW